MSAHVRMGRLYVGGHGCLGTTAIFVAYSLFWVMVLGIAGLILAAMVAYAAFVTVYTAVRATYRRFVVSWGQRSAAVATGAIWGAVAVAVLWFSVSR